jgi:hypothetical protein
MGQPRRRHRWLLAALVAAAACSDGSSQPQAEPVDAGRSAARTVEAEPTTSDASDTDAFGSSVLDDAALNPEGVINAAVLLHSGGDVESALVAGAFTRDELDAARGGLADGSLAYLFD